MQSKKKIFQVAQPYFSKKDIAWVKNRVEDVLVGKLSTGPYTKKFENIFSKFIGVKYAVFLNSCTSALEIAIKYLNLNNNDEVLVPVQTFIATGTAVTSQNAKIVFTEINSETFCIDLDEIKSKVNNRTKAIMLVHFGGYTPYDIIKIKNFCKKKKIFLIEDCAHSIGTKIGNYTAGSIGDIGCFSFFSTKTITTGEGGMFTTNNKKIYEYALSMRERGRDLNHPTEIYDKSWRNCRVPEFSAILGLNQFNNIKNIITHRNRICDVYDKIINKSQNFRTLKRSNKIRYSIWKHITLIQNKNIKRENLRDHLFSEHGIVINWAYDPPLHLQPLYKKSLGIKKGYLKYSENLMSNHFHLPLHMNISLNDAKYIANSLLEISSRIIR